jgi:CheY-like chemotaxis protein
MTPARSTKVLFADDSATVRLTLKKYLQSAGFTTEESSDGREALEKFKSFNPDVVLLDLQMPIIDGFNVCEAIKEDTDTPVIILTSMDEESDKDWALSHGADRYLNKPIDQDELVNEIETVLAE